MEHGVCCPPVRGFILLQGRGGERQTRRAAGLGEAPCRAPAIPSPALRNTNHAARGTPCADGTGMRRRSKMKESSLSAGPTEVSLDARLFPGPVQASSVALKLV
ncbi:hypothetical protein Bbelb_333470 [Branchiostoma belcheri]|nr:hypothetical protein Bbelb_333470 [Branchiostoma belcheri]